MLMATEAVQSTKYIKGALSAFPEVRGDFATWYKQRVSNDTTPSIYTGYMYEQVQLCAQAMSKMIVQVRVALTIH